MTLSFAATALPSEDRRCLTPDHMTHGQIYFVRAQGPVPTD